MHKMSYLASLFSFLRRCSFSYVALLYAFRRALQKEKKSAQFYAIGHMTEHYNPDLKAWELAGYPCGTEFTVQSFLLAWGLRVIYC